jgi:hypothetical protein
MGVSRARYAKTASFFSVIVHIHALCNNSAMKKLIIFLALGLTSFSSAFAVTVFQDDNGSIVAVHEDGRSWRLFDSHSRASDFSGSASGAVVVFRYANELHAVTEAGQYAVLSDSRFPVEMGHSLGGEVVIFKNNGYSGLQAITGGGLTVKVNGNDVCTDYSGNASGNPAVVHNCRRDWVVSRDARVR